MDYDLFETFARTNESFVQFILKSATFDTNVFNTSAGLIYKTPEEINYSGLEPIINTITLPIPRILWKNKPAGEYLKNAYKTIYDGYLWEIGSAHLGFAEYYLAGMDSFNSCKLFIGVFLRSYGVIFC